MINNSRRSVLGALMGFVICAGCEAPTEGPTPWQGIVEFEERTLAFEVPGRLLAVEVDEGDRVEPGHKIARLDDTLERLARDAKAAEARAVKSELELLEVGSRPEDIQQVKASLRAAEASRRLAEDTLAREEKLGAQGVGAKAELDAARTSLTTANARKRELEATLTRLRRGARDQEIAAAAARLDAAEAAVTASDARIARHTLATESNGIVLDVHVEPDEVTQAGTPVVTIGDVEHPYVDVFVPQDHVDGLSLGDAVHVRVDAHALPFEGRVEHIARSTEYTPRFLFSERERPNLVVRVRVRIDAPAGDLHAGLPAFATPAQELL
jgi:HlyD family secretion protein